MDVVWLARLQFSLTIMFHFLFPPITIGLALLVFLLETARWRTARRSTAGPPTSGSASSP